MKKYYSASLCIILAFSISACAYTPKINSPRGIASLEYIDLGGIRQLVLIRGKDISNPLVLYLHGGPGSVAIPLEHCIRDLEDHCIIAVWDQRGAGKSYRKGMTRESYAIKQYLSDASELIHILLKRFNKKKIYLIGHSWGSILGVLTARDHPDLLYAYIGIGQVVNMADNERLSYQYTLSKATEEKNEKAVKDLKGIAPPYLDDAGRLNIEHLYRERQWLDKLGGVTCDRSKGNALMIRNFLKSTEYTLPELLGTVEAGMRRSCSYTWNEMLGIDFIKQAPRLDVPVYFFIGRCDYNTPFELSYRYYQGLEAPKGKHFVWFEQSGHILILEEYEKFKTEMLRVISETQER